MEFKNKEVGDKFTSNAEIDFLISVPNFYGPRKPFSEIDVPTAQELVRQKFNHIQAKPAAKEETE